jgi:hypothetical protein
VSSEEEQSGWLETFYDWTYWAPRMYYHG